MEAQHPRTLMGGFSTPAPPLPPAAGATASTIDPSAPVKTAPMASVGSAIHGSSPPAENPLAKTLAMPDAPRPMHFALAAPTPAAPPPLVPASIPPAVNEERGKIAAQASFLRNSMPTAPAFAPLVPIAHGRRPKKTGLAMFVAAFAVTIVVVVAVLWVLDKKAPPPAVAVASTRAAEPTTARESASATAVATATATAAPTATTAAVTTAAPTAAASVTTTAASTTIAGLSATKGAIVAGKAARQHRVYVDDKLVGEGPGDYVVRCGSHTVKVGSAGKSLDVDVPCNGQVDVP